MKLNPTYRAIWNALTRRDEILLANAVAQVECLENIVDGADYLANEAQSDATGKNWVKLSGYGDFPHANGIQRLQKADAEIIVANFKSTIPIIKSVGDIASQVGSKIMGLPWYVGHPDHAAHSAKFPDTAAKGRIKDLEARDDGLYANVKWNDEGKALIKSEAFHGHSVVWWLQRDGSVLRPTRLKSVGFTNEPNMPCDPILSANETDMFLKQLAALLGLPETASEADVTTAINALKSECCEMKEACNTATAARETAIADALAKADLVTAANVRATKAEADLLAANTALETAKTDAAAKETLFANERAARSKDILDAAINTGKITLAERPKFETLLANSFEEAVTTIGGKKINLKLAANAVNLGDRTHGAANLELLANTLVEKEGLTWDGAFAKLRATRPELFEKAK